MAFNGNQNQVSLTTEPSLNCTKETLSWILTRLHSGYFRISLSLCGQALLWKTLSDHTSYSYPLQRIFRMMPSTAFVLLWSLTLVILFILSLLYLLRFIFHFSLVRAEFLHHIGVNYLFAPWISWLLLLQCSPFLSPNGYSYHVFLWIFALPVLALDVKIYGQWFIKGKKLLSTMANPTHQISVIGNLVGARAVAIMGWQEIAVFMFSLGITHYMVLFITLYQRFSSSNRLPAKLRPVFFLFVAAPSMASLSWVSISGKFDTFAKIFFFLSLFLFASLISRPTLFKKSMKKFNVAWWAYSFPLSVLALASAEYAEQVNGSISHGLMLALAVLSVLVSFILMVFTALNSHVIFPYSGSGLPHSKELPTSTTNCN